MDTVPRWRGSVHRQAVGKEPRGEIEDREIAVRGIDERQTPQTRVDLAENEPDQRHAAPEQRADQIADERDRTGRQNPFERGICNHRPRAGAKTPPRLTTVTPARRLRMSTF